MNILIVDDEPLARVHVRRVLESLNERVVGEAADAAEALQEAERLRPDLLILDIQMPGLTGLQMATALQSLDSPPLIVFVTGYSEHAIDAFEQSALDYILKPVSPERLIKTLARARERLDERVSRRQKTDDNEVASIAETDPEVPKLQPLTRLPIREDYTVRFIRVEEIICAVARDKRVAIRTVEGDRRTYYTLTQLESLLPDGQFLRIHDSAIVNLQRVQELHSLGSHAYAVKLDSGLQLPVSRSRYPELHRRLGLNALPSS